MVNNYNKLYFKLSVITINYKYSIIDMYLANLFFLYRLVFDREIVYYVDNYSKEL